MEHPLIGSLFAGLMGLAIIGLIVADTVDAIQRSVKRKRVMNALKDRV